MAQPTSAAAIDPRKIITPESFHVAPHLLGLPLASPSRRLAAILLDLLFCSILANVGGKVLFALALGASFFWFAGNKLGKGGTFFSRSARAALRGVGALFVFIAAASLWGSAQKKIHDAENGEGAGPRQASMAGGDGPSVAGALRMGSAMIAVMNADDSAHADSAARGAVRQLRRSGMTNAQIREVFADTGRDADSDEKPWLAGA
ncbi:MAG TPA: hypothetical protein VJT67_06950, partial [Longimicrobiaceae bacterium]|nr:hypothetical protein [Longimicrobiaceae bacterium]